MVAKKSKTSQPIRGKGGIFVFRLTQETQTWYKTLSSLVPISSTVVEEKLKMSNPIRGQGGHLGFLIHLKNTNLVDDVEYVLPVKFR